ncbi:MAG: class I SAM-dependent methyltransferase [Saprospiraceae bacterium]|nr:class I SAM-dependent methyltransferase [Saprospiraceae bacterium]
MNWEETIIAIRKREDLQALVHQSYIHEDLELNVRNFAVSEEFKATLNLLKHYAPEATSILDVGSGNGITAINFALKGYQVTAVEPDESDTVGAGAINILKAKYKLDNIEVHQSLAEEIKFEDNTFDVVYIRQAMHHAKDLNAFIKECVRVLKPKGLLLSIRDHVIFNHQDKTWFLDSHPLHQFYGGENAFTPRAYKTAIELAGATVVKELKYYDSIINYFPLSEADCQAKKAMEIEQQQQRLKNKIGILYKLPFVWYFYTLISGFTPLDEKKIPGRMYSYIALKT